MCLLEWPLSVWATMTINRECLDLLFCAMARSIKLIPRATLLILNKHGLKSEVCRAVKMWQARESVRSLLVDGETQTPISLVVKWQTTEANNPIWWACRGTLCNQSHCNSSLLLTSRSLERTVMDTWEALESPIAMDRLIWLAQTMVLKKALLTLNRATYSLDWQFSAIVRMTKDLEGSDSP